VKNLIVIVLAVFFVVGTASISIAAESISGLEKRVEALEKEKGFLTYKGAEFQLKGEVELELKDIERESDTDVPNVSGTDTNEPEMHFDVDKVVLQPIIKIGDNLKLDAQLYFLESEAELNEVHAKFSHLILDTWVDVGMYERWCKGFYGQQTEGYPILGTAFFRDDAITVTWGGDLKPLYWMVSVGNGYEIDDKTVIEDSGGINDVLHDDRSTSDFNNLEFGFNLGLKQEIAGGKLDLLGFCYVDQLSSGDILALDGFLPSSYTSVDDDKSRLGFGANYKAGGLKLTGMYIVAEDGDLDRDAVAVEVSNHFKLGNSKWFTGVTPLVSYSSLDIDDSYDRDVTIPESWDRDKWIIAGIIDLYNNTKLKVEYYINEESTSDREVDNDELLVQLEVKF